MKRRVIDINEYAGVITKALNPGILLTTKSGEKVNTMVIGWGTVGINWGLPVFAAYVRESRYTKELLDENPHFTVNVPLGELDNKYIRICGTKSGRDTDKIKEAELTLAEPAVLDVPGIKEFPLTLECQVIYRQEQDEKAYAPAILNRYYPQDKDGQRDTHITYFGEIVAAYIIEDE